MITNTSNEKYIDIQKFLQLLLYLRSYNITKIFKFHCKFRF